MMQMKNPSIDFLHAQHLILKNSFPYKLLLLSIRTTPFSSHSALEKSPLALEPPNTFSFPISQGRQLPSHYFITP